MSKQIGDLPNMKATLIDGELYVREFDCRANVSAALATKKPLIAALEATLREYDDGSEFPVTHPISLARTALRPKAS